MSPNVCIWCREKAVNPMLERFCTGCFIQVCEAAQNKWVERSREKLEAFKARKEAA